MHLSAAPIDLSLLIRDYTVTAQAPRVCVNLTTRRDNVVSSNYIISFYLEAKTLAPNVEVDIGSVLYRIRETES